MKTKAVILLVVFLLTFSMFLGCARQQKSVSLDIEESIPTTLEPIDQSFTPTSDAVATPNSLEATPAPDAEDDPLDAPTEVPETVSESDESKTDEDSNNDLIDPVFKEAMDSYEAFVDEYCAFMKKYKESSDPLAMMDDYSAYLTKYTEAMNKISKINESDLNTTEQLYYIDVTNRCSKKMLEVAQ